MQVFTEDGTRVDARVNGREHLNAVVFIHGFTLSASIWDAQQSLAADACVVRPDLRGAGNSSAPEGPYLMESLAADVALLLDSLGIERASLVGHSMGGYVALSFARMFTERVAGLALVASRLRADTPQEAQARRELADRVERESSVEPVIEGLARLFAPSTLEHRRSVVDYVYGIALHTSPVGAAAALRGMALRASSEDIAEDFEMPMLMVAGARDAVVPLAESRAVAQRFKRGRLVICEESGHLPMVEEPALVTTALREWLLSEALI